MIWFLSQRLLVVAAGLGNWCTRLVDQRLTKAKTAGLGFLVALARIVTVDMCDALVSNTRQLHNPDDFPATQIGHRKIPNYPNPPESLSG
ncbi:MAG: hypothetical protein AAGF01_24520 [Cyanobacteria bacterium P01_G01_bin.38]